RERLRIFGRSLASPQTCVSPSLRRDLPAAAPTLDQDDDSNQQCDRNRHPGDDSETARKRGNDGDMLAEKVSAEHPQPHPPPLPARLERGNPLPPLPRLSRHDTVELAQDVDEASEGDGCRAVSREYPLDGVEARRRQPDPGAVAGDGGSAEPPADRISDI